MGNQQTVPTNIERLQAQNWVEAGEDQQNALFLNVNPFRRRLLANIITHELIQQYELNFITEQDYNSYLMQLSYRQSKHSYRQQYQPQSYIYPIRYFVNKSKNEMCTTIHTGYLYADKVNLRLKQINDIPFQDLLYLYKATINGFKSLYQKVGYFDIVEQMIFITKRGEVKVWMNANLAKNYPNYEKAGYSSKNNSSDNLYNFNNKLKKQGQNLHGSQADMIRKLIMLIQKNSDEYSESYQRQICHQHELFSQFLESKHLFDKLSFQHCLEEFENYLCQHNLHSPDYMKSIPELFAPDQNLSFPTKNYEQSHVNQITSQRLDQMKKKLQPMEVITQNLSNSKTYHQYQKISPKFHQRNQNTYVSPVNINQTIQQDNNFRKMVQPFTDLHQSQHSYQSSNLRNQSDHLHRSSNSHPISKPNSVSTVDRQKREVPINLRNHPQYYYQSQRQPNPQNFIFQNPFQDGGGFFQQPYHQNDFPQRFVVFNQPQNFHFMNGANHYVSNKHVLPPKQNITLSSYQQNIVKLSPSPKQKYQQATYPNKLALPIKSQSLQQKSSKQSEKKSSLRQNQRRQSEYQQKSKIKYFTTKDSYHLDEQIASDLQKFLGLKVN